jgi:hypothetical protein
MARMTRSRIAGLVGVVLLGGLLSGCSYNKFVGQEEAIKSLSQAAGSTGAKIPSRTWSKP